MNSIEFENVKQTNLRISKFDITGLLINIFTLLSLTNNANFDGMRAEEKQVSFERKYYVPEAMTETYWHRSWARLAEELIFALILLTMLI